MRHEPIHAIDCRCDRCTPVPVPSQIDRDDLAAIRKGLIAGSWAVGLVAAAKLTPSIIDWLAS